MSSLFPPDSPQYRQALRRELRHRRRSLSPYQQKLAARALSQKLWRLPEVQQARRIALYWPADGEISPLPFAQTAWRRGRQLLLPVLRRFPQPHLRFTPWRPGQRLRRNRFGIPEPSGRSRAAQALDLILLPLVGFDRQGGRLGMGGGFYDRSLAFKLRLPARQPNLLGLAHERQAVDQLPLADWDVPLLAIVSEQACWRGRPRATSEESSARNSHLT